MMEIDGNEETILYARASSINTVITNHLQQLSSSNQLVHYHNLPSNILFIQTQSDKGGDSTKLSIQSLNRNYINSVSHLIPVVCYEGPTLHSRKAHVSRSVVSHMIYILLGVGENYEVACRLFKPIVDSLTTLHQQQQQQLHLLVLHAQHASINIHKHQINIHP